MIYNLLFIVSAAPNDLKLADLTLRKRKVKKRTKRSTLNCGGSERTVRSERTEGTARLERTDNENMRREDLRESTESSLQNTSGKYFRSSNYLSKITSPPVHIYTI